MFRAWAVRHAATETCRSSSRVRPPDTEVNAPVNAGTHAITSRITSGRSTRGSIGATRLRRSTSDGGSGMAVSLGTCSRPWSSTRVSIVPAETCAATSRSASSRARACSASSASGSSRSCRSVSAGPFARVPLRARQQLRAGVAPAGRCLGVDLAALQVPVKGRQDAEHPRRCGRTRRRLRQHQGLPRPGQQPRGRCRRRRPSCGGQRRGRACIAASAASPSGVQPNVMTSVRIFRNSVTMAIRSASRARSLGSGSEPGGGSMSDTASTDSRSWRRGTSPRSTPTPAPGSAPRRRR